MKMTAGVPKGAPAVIFLVGLGATVPILPDQVDAACLFYLAIPGRQPEMDHAVGF
jgi:hypothetical protein